MTAPTPLPVLEVFAVALLFAVHDQHNHIGISHLLAAITKTTATVDSLTPPSATLHPAPHVEMSFTPEAASAIQSLRESDALTVDSLRSALLAINLHP